VKPSIMTISSKPGVRGKFNKNLTPQTTYNEHLEGPESKLWPHLLE